MNNCKYFYLSSYSSYDTISPLGLFKKRNLLIFIKIQDRNVFVLKVVKIDKFSVIIGPLLVVTDKFIKLDNFVGISYICRPITLSFANLTITGCLT